jgi:ribonucleoside-diphosphate reductase alpha chain
MASVQLSTPAVAVLQKRYLRKDAQGRVIETPEEMFWRVARNIAEAERLYNHSTSVEALSEIFFLMMASLDFLPNSPCLMNADCPNPSKRGGDGFFIQPSETKT